MLRFDVVTIFPQMLNVVVAAGVTGRAREKGIYELVAWNPRDFAAWVNLAVANRQIGKIAEAQRALEQALKINPRVAHPWYLLGRLLLEDGKPTEAVEPLAG